MLRRAFVFFLSLWGSISSWAQCEQWLTRTQSWPRGTWAQVEAVRAGQPLTLLGPWNGLAQDPTRLCIGDCEVLPEEVRVLKGPLEILAPGTKIRVKLKASGENISGKVVELFEAGSPEATLVLEDLQGTRHTYRCNAFEEGSVQITQAATTEYDGDLLPAVMKTQVGQPIRLLTDSLRLLRGNFGGFELRGDGLVQLRVGEESLPLSTVLALDGLSDSLSDEALLERLTTGEEWEQLAVVLKLSQSAPDQHLALVQPLMQFLDAPGVRQFVSLSHSDKRALSSLDVTASLRAKRRLQVFYFALQSSWRTPADGDVLRAAEWKILDEKLKAFHSQAKQPAEPAADVMDPLPLVNQILKGLDQLGIDPLRDQWAAHRELGDERFDPNLVIRLNRQFESFTATRVSLFEFRQALKPLDEKARRALYPRLQAALDAAAYAVGLLADHKNEFEELHARMNQAEKSFTEQTQKTFAEIKQRQRDEVIVDAFTVAVAVDSDVMTEAHRLAKFKAILASRADIDWSSVRNAQGQSFSQLPLKGSVKKVLRLFNP